MSAIQPLERFDVENEREERLRVERELQRRHEKGQDLELGFGEAPFGLIFSDANGVRVSVALDGSSNLTATNVDTGDSVTLVDYADIGGAPTSLAELDATAAQELVDIRVDFELADASITSAYIAADALVTSNAASARATLSANLTASFQAADAVLDGQIVVNTASITTNSTAISTNESAIATLGTTVSSNTVAIGERVTTATYDAQVAALTSADAAQTVALETTEASIRREGERVNLLPAQYQLFIGDDTPGFQFIQASVSQDARDHIFRRGNQPARFDQDSAAQNFLTVRFHSAPNETNMQLPPGKYGFKCSVLGGGSIIDFRARLRRADNSQSQQTLFASTGADGQLLEGVWDLSAETESDFYFEITCLTSTSAVGRWIPYRFQIVALPDDATEPGDFVSPGLNAAVEVLRTAFVGSDGRAVASFQAVASASGSTPARIGLRSGDGTSAIVLDADNLFLGDNTVFEDAYNSFVTEEGGDRNRFGGPFPASGDLLEWFGPTSVTLNSETRTNGYFAKGTDGKVYYGATELNSGSGFTAVGNPTSITNAANNSSYSNGITCVATGGSGGNTYNWFFLSETGANWSFSNDSISNPNVIANTITERPSIARLGCLVVDNQGNTAQMKPVTVQYGTVGG